MTVAVPPPSRCSAARRVPRAGSTSAAARSTGRGGWKSAASATSSRPTPLRDWRCWRRKPKGCASSRAPVRYACRRPRRVTARDGCAFLVLEWLDFGGGGRDAALGTALAQLHRTTAEAHGWHRDNTIGTTPQDNARTGDWAAFFRDRRIAPQLALAARNGHGRRLQRIGEQLLVAIPLLLAGHAPGGVAAARRPVVRQCRATRVRRAGDLRPCGLLRRSGSRSRDDRALRRLPGRLLRGVSRRMADRRGLSRCAARSTTSTTC